MCVEKYFRRHVGDLGTESIYNKSYNKDFNTPQIEIVNRLSNHYQT